jgi:prepilin signal peptidase PulO-like enzyme (type II secretory pathway)
MTAGGFSFLFLRLTLKQSHFSGALLGATCGAVLVTEATPYVVAAFLGGAFAAWAIYDSQAGMIPNMLTYPIIALFAAFDVFVNPHHLLAFGIAPVLLVLANWPKRGAMGGGDIKALVLMGLALGLWPVTVSLAVSCLLVLLVAVIYTQMGKFEPGHSFRLGPYLMVGGLVGTPVARALAGLLGDPGLARFLLTIDGFRPLTVLLPQASFPISNLNGLSTFLH